VVVRYLIGDLLTGTRIQWLQPVSGSWSEVLNDAGDLSCSVLLSDPVNAALGLRESAAVGKAFLAAVDGDLVLQAGPIWVHDWDDDSQTLTLTASGMWSYFDHRVLLPVLADRLPTDVTTDTRFSNIVSDPDAVGYPWVSDTRESLQTIAVRLVEQAQTWTNGDVPVILPDEEAGTSERWYKGSALAFVGQRLRELSGVIDGPDIMFTPRWTTDRLGIEWVMRVGTPSEPLLYSAQRQKFQLGIAGSSLSNLRVKVDGSRLASTAFASGGKSDGQAIVTVSEDTTLTAAGYPTLDAVDSSHSTASEEATVQQYSDELVLHGKTPSTVWSFTHELSQRPYLQAFNAGDFATVSVRGSAYLEDGESTMRLLSRSGDIEGRKVSLDFAPEVVSG
jgi:hypothetical protein